MTVRILYRLIASASWPGSSCPLRYRTPRLTSSQWSQTSRPCRSSEISQAATSAAASGTSPESTFRIDKVLHGRAGAPIAPIRGRKRNSGSVNGAAAMVQDPDHGGEW